MRITTRAVFKMLPEGGFIELERDSYEYEGPVAKAGGGKGGSETVTQETTVPDFLKPFLRQGAGTGSGALRNLQQLLGGDLAADFNPIQQQAFDLITQQATGGELIPTAQNAFLQAAQGQPIPGLSFLEQAAQSGGIPEQALQTLTQGARTSALPQETIQQLQRTAGGDFLTGGEGFDQAVQAAVRAAQPGILSTFGGAGVGGGTGALSQAAIGQAATDAFARQFAQERQNQLGAQGTLASLGLSDRAQQLGSAESLGALGLSGLGQQIDASGLLGRLGLGGQSQQLRAAGALPGLAFAGLEPLLNVGNLQQQQAQQEISAPITGQQQLLQSALGITPSFSPLFGQTQTTERESNPLSSLLGAGLTAASIFGTGGLGAGLGGLFGGGGLSPITVPAFTPRG